MFFFALRQALLYGCLYRDIFTLNFSLSLSVSGSVTLLSKVRDLYFQRCAFSLFTYSPPLSFLLLKPLSVGSKTRQNHNKTPSPSRTQQHRPLTRTTHWTVWCDPLENGAAQFVCVTQMWTSLNHTMPPNFHNPLSNMAYRKPMVRIYRLSCEEWLQGGNTT